VKGPLRGLARTLEYVKGPLEVWLGTLESPDGPLEAWLGTLKSLDGPLEAWLGTLESPDGPLEAWLGTLESPDGPLDGSPDTPEYLEGPPPAPQMGDVQNTITFTKRYFFVRKELRVREFPYSGVRTGSLDLRRGYTRPQCRATTKSFSAVALDRQKSSVPLLPSTAATVSFV
jgi:hypothetical protein